MFERRKEEFYCGECKKYFLTYLRRNMNGAYTVQCPSCGHHHYRVVKEGFVTDQRKNEEANHLDILIGLKSTIRNKSWLLDPDFRKGVIA